MPKTGDAVTWLITAGEAVSMATVISLHTIYGIKNAARSFRIKSSVQDHTSVVLRSEPLPNTE